MTSLPPSINIFIGEPIQYESERLCLQSIIQKLSEEHNWAYVFANFHATGRQIDIAVFTESSTFIVEVKGYQYAVRGDINGEWEQRLSGSARKIVNAYNQALNAKNALRNEIDKYFHIEGYPNGYVAIIPTIPHGSKLTSGDFKVKIIELAELSQLLSEPSKTLLQPDQCEKLAFHLKLEKVNSIEAALSNDLYDAEKILNSYLFAFKNYHLPDIAEFLGDEYETDSESINLEKLEQLAFKENNDLLIIGPSGCGKTLLAKNLATTCISQNITPIFIAAKDFDGKLRNSLEKEITLLFTNRTATLLNASKLLNKKIALFLDGYNECSDEQKLALTRGLKAFSQRYGASIIITTQKEITRQDLLNTKKIVINSPSYAFKIKLSKINEKNINKTDIYDLLQIASSGLEAKIIGDVALDIPKGASKFVQFDYFIRDKLKSNSAVGFRLFSELAKVLIDKSSFIFSRREFDRLCDSLDLKENIRSNIIQTNIITIRGDNISFAHEQYFLFFSAESLMRQSKQDLALIHKALKSPHYNHSKEFIVGAIDDERTLLQLIEALDNRELITACYRGKCGGMAHTIVKKRIDLLIDLLIKESKNIRFQFSDNAFYGITIDKTTLLSKSENFLSYVDAISQGLVAGLYLDKILLACSYADQNIEYFVNEQKRKGRKSPRSKLFFTTYMLSVSSLSQLINSIYNLTWASREKLEIKSLNAWPMARSAGQIYLLLKLTECAKNRYEYIDNIIVVLNKLATYPFNLQMELIKLTTYFSSANNNDRSRIIDILMRSLESSKNWAINTTIVDTLSILGAWEDESNHYIPVVYQEIKEALKTDTLEAEQKSWAIYYSQFDHPYSHIYSEIINNLDVESKKALLIKACKTNNPDMLFLSILIRELSNFNDPNVASAIEKWLALPNKKSINPQEAIEVFIFAHEAFSSLNVPLPKTETASSTYVDKTLLAYAELHYWACRTDLTKKEKEIYAEIAQNTFVQHANCSANILKWGSSFILSRDGARIHFIEHYPRLCLKVCREYLEKQPAQLFYFDNEKHFYSPHLLACFVIQVIAHIGDRTDLLLLRTLSKDENLGIDALSAIKKIEEKSIK